MRQPQAPRKIFDSALKHSTDCTHHTHSYMLHAGMKRQTQTVADKMPTDRHKGPDQVHSKPSCEYARGSVACNNQGVTPDVLCHSEVFIAVHSVKPAAATAAHNEQQTLDCEIHETKIHNLALWLAAGLGSCNAQAG